MSIIEFPKPKPLDVMTSAHLRWPEFIFRLDQALAIHKDPATGRDIWSCDNKTLSRASAILGEMGGFDIPETLESFRSQGAVCDCEVMFNLVDWDEMCGED